MALSAPAAELIGTLLDVMGYGIYLVVFVQCISILWMKRREGQVSAQYFVGVALIFFAVVTVHVITDIIRTMQAFTVHTEIPNWAVTVYANTANSIILVKNVSFVIAVLVSDIFFVYRTFIVWGGNYIVITIPFLLFMADCGSAIWTSYSLAQVKNGVNPLLAGVAVSSKYYYIITLVLNVLCTFLVSYKIWTTTRHVVGSTVGRRPMSIVSIVIESAAIYSAFWILLLVTDIIGSNVNDIVLNFMAVVTGIIFSMLIIRTSVGYNSGYWQSRSILRPPFTVGLTSSPQRQSTTVTSQTKLSYPGGVHIQLEQITHADPNDEILAGKMDSDPDVPV